VLSDEGRPPRGDSPLHYSAINGSVECVQMLLRLNADVNRPSARYGETPLHKAVLFQRTEVVRALLAAGADSAARNDRGFSALTLCAMCGGDELGEAFSGHGARVRPMRAADLRAGAITPAGHSDLPWSLVVALYLYRRPRTARETLCETLAAAHETGFTVDRYIPQLCDLAVHEPAGDGAVRRALIAMALRSHTFAFAAYYFVASIQASRHDHRAPGAPQDAARASRELREALERVVFGCTAAVRVREKARSGDSGVGAGAGREREGDATPSPLPATPLSETPHAPQTPQELPLRAAGSARSLGGTPAAGDEHGDGGRDEVRRQAPWVAEAGPECGNTPRTQGEVLAVPSQGGAALLQRADSQRLEAGGPAGANGRGTAGWGAERPSVPKELMSELGEHNCNWTVAPQVPQQLHPRVRSTRMLRALCDRAEL